MLAKMKKKADKFITNDKPEQGAEASE
jgi:hypothetical protein